MRIEKVVINASPLIVLFKSGQADLLPQLFPTIVIPDAVFQEVTLSKNDIAAQQLPTTQWFPVPAHYQLSILNSQLLKCPTPSPKKKSPKPKRKAGQNSIWQG